MMTKAQIQYFIENFNEITSVDKDILKKYGQDETEDLLFMPEVVLHPSTTKEVSALLKYCNEQLIPVTPSGARTGLSGGALPIKGGVVLSFERMNKIIAIDENNFQVTVEPGVITKVLQEAVKEKGLFYPPDPASKGSCFIGGNIAENSGGPKAVKYGVTASYVLNLEVVLPNGEVIWTGADSIKNATGYNITQLIVGSEGTLGVVTKIVLRLIPHPTHDLLLFVPFKSAEKACEAVVSIMSSGITPSGLEFMERDAVAWTLDKFPEIQFEIEQNAQAFLLIEVDGFNENVLFQDIEKIHEILSHFETGEILFADSQATKDKLWEIRRKISEAVKKNSIYKEEDTVVRRFEIPKLLKGVKEIGDKYGFKSVCYGHVGDGNLHVNIIKGDLTDEQWNNELPNAIREIFKLSVALGGTISGEHGIGLVQKQYMDIPFTDTSLQIMREIKKIFDPNNILNPGKIVDV